MRKSLKEWCWESNRMDILEEWHKDNNIVLSPDTVSYGSEKVVTWMCSKCKNEWEAMICRRTNKNGTGCPKCSKINQVKKTNRAKLLKSGSFQEKFPQLLNEWDYELNKEIVPSDFSSGSNKNVWWKCTNCKKSYKSRISSRTHGSGCPKCKVLRRNKSFIKSNGSLYSFHPELEKEWHPTKNRELTIKNITRNSNKKIWWLCENGHEWSASAATRNKGHGCPYCAGIYPTKENNLLLKAPDLAKEWHPTKNRDLIPANVSPFSMKEIWWKCERGHEWKASASNRYQGRGCAQCSAELRSSFPEQAIIFYLSEFFKVESRSIHNGWEIDVFLPEYNLGIEYDGIAYHNKQHHKDRENKKNKAFQDIGLDLIRIKESYNTQDVSGQTIFFIVDYSYKYLPKALKQLFQLVEFKTKKNIDVKVDIEKDRIDILSQYVLIEKKNSFAEKFPNLIYLWNEKRNLNLRPDSVLSMSNRKIWWVCEKGHEWEETVINVAKGNRCPYCSNHKVLTGFNDFQTEYPDLSKEWDYEKNNLKPSDVTSGSNQKVWWICGKNHEWRATVARRTRRSNCPFCSGTHKKTPLNHTQWMQKYKQAKDYYFKHNNLDVKATYVCNNGFKLGNWIRTQRVSYKNDDLTQERYKLLEEIGMVWSSSPGSKKK
ncbi:zinc-ribbon domain-containing protein [Halobacillus sp. K22]|uniref:zinc-ribbon domain-containing protein n=1 Tax=Halobacillus sp. K22 TaxID=3457431 RepID=UPI003FCDA8EE